MSTRRGTAIFLQDVLDEAKVAFGQSPRIINFSFSSLLFGDCFPFCLQERMLAILKSNSEKLQHINNVEEVAEQVR